MFSAYLIHAFPWLHIRNRARFTLVAIITMLIAGPSLTLAANEGDPPHLPADLTELSLKELINVEVTSVSKKGQPLSQRAAAIFVITQDDIRRSGITSIPEALRMVPGLNVAKLDGNKWAITARGLDLLVHATPHGHSRNGAGNTARQVRLQRETDLNRGRQRDEPDDPGTSSASLGHHILERRIRGSSTGPLAQGQP